MPTELDAPMWAAAAEGLLKVQQCVTCDAHRYPPTRACYRCQSTAWRWDTLPGTGSVATYTWVLDRDRTSGPSTHYNVAVVTLDGTVGEPVRMVSNIIDAWDLGDLRIGTPVELATLRLSDEVGLPLFRLSSTGADR